MESEELFEQGRKYLFHHVTKNTTYQIIGKVFTALSSLIIIRIVTQHYGTSGAGELTLVLNYLNIFYLLIDFGLNAIVVKLMIESPSEETSLYKSALGLRLVTGAVLGLIAIIFAYLFSGIIAGQDPASAMSFFRDISLLAITIIFQAVYLTTNAVFQRRLFYDRSTFANAAGSVVGVISFFLLAKPSVPLFVPLAAYFFNYLATAGIAIYLLPIPLTEKIIPYFRSADWKKLVKPSLPIAATLVLNVVYFKSDSFVLASLKPLSDVGIYGIAYKIFEQAIVIPVFFVNALYPVLLNQMTYFPQKLKRTLIMCSVLLLGGGVLIAAAEIILAPQLVQIVAGGSNFSDAVLPLRILAAGLPFFFLSNLFLWLLVTLGQQKHLIVIYGVSMVFNIVMNLILIPQYSYIASASLTAISEAIVLALTMSYGLYFLKKKLQEETTPPSSSF